ncbi:DUF2637 domain-containing protein [Streptomyces sp. NPDC006798]|uniref:DUF2637 domain-containing protein n=1 Tax=Streptomyces sp. NPDC006798 TaxID=3155462 RepID=UPI00340787DF
MKEDRITQRTVTVVMIIIAALAFVFSFGNVWSLALRLGIPEPIAPLIAPMVDLSVVGLMVALHHLSLRGVSAEELKAATRLMHVSGLLTLALNIAEPIIAGHYGRAAVDAVAPLLLLSWGTVGPQLLRHFHAVAIESAPAPSPDRPPAPQPVALGDADTKASPEIAAPAVEPLLPVGPAPAPDRPAPASTAPASKLPEPLLNEARSIALSHQAEHGEPITSAQLKARLGIDLPMATALHAAL